MEKKYQVFVSSTYLDLVKEREAAIKAILELHCIPSGMELFPASDDEKWALIKRVIDECDYFVLILAGKYGSQGEGGIGYTEMEYRYAEQREKPIIAFVHADPTSLPQKFCEVETALRDALARFTAYVTSKRLVKKWSTPDELGSHLKTSLIDAIRTNPSEGWVRASAVAIARPSSAQDFFQHDDYPSDLNTLLQRCSTAIFWGGAFIRFVQHMRDQIELRVRQGAHIKFLMLEPDGAALPMLNLRGNPEDIPNRRSDLKRNIEILRTISRKPAQGSLEVRAIDYLPPYTVVAYDIDQPSGKLFVWLGSIGIPNSERPMFSLVRSVDPVWFDFFVNQFSLTWALGTLAGC
ncbi:MAG: DUF4062 domain-containing protein [Acidobacteriota bacterium]